MYYCGVLMSKMFIIQDLNDLDRATQGITEKVGPTAKLHTYAILNNVDFQKFKKLPKIGGCVLLGIDGVPSRLCSFKVKKDNTGEFCIVRGSWVDSPITSDWHGHAGQLLDEESESQLVVEGLKFIQSHCDLKDLTMFSRIIDSDEDKIFNHYLKNDPSSRDFLLIHGLEKRKDLLEKEKLIVNTFSPQGQPNLRQNNYLTMYYKLRDKK